MVVTISLNANEVNKLMKNIVKFPQHFEKAGYEWCSALVKTFKFESVNSKRATASRKILAQQIKVRKKNKKGTQITMPKKLINLDRMEPHFVALKRGRAITRWAKRYYGSMKVAGRSRVYRGPKGGIRHEKGWKSALFVSPDPFIDKSIKIAQRKLPQILNKAIRRTLRGGA